MGRLRVDQVQRAVGRREWHPWSVSPVAEDGGKVGAVDTPIGRRPVDGDLQVDGIGVSPEQLAELFAVDGATWLAEADLIEEYFGLFGDRVPGELRDQLAALRSRLASA